MTCCLQLTVCSCSVAKELRERVLRGKYRIPFYMSTDCENLLKRFLVLNPTKRGTLEVTAQMMCIIFCKVHFWGVIYYFHPVPMHIWGGGGIVDESTWVFKDIFYWGCNTPDSSYFQIQCVTTLSMSYNFSWWLACGFLHLCMIHHIIFHILSCELEILALVVAFCTLLEE